MASATSGASIASCTARGSWQAGETVESRRPPQEGAEAVVAMLSFIEREWWPRVSCECLPARMEVSGAREDAQSSMCDEQGSVPLQGR
jgi:hypothetical protein